MAEDHGHNEGGEGGGGDDHGGGHKAHKSHGPPHGGGGHEEHAGAPEWLISFADNVALLMGFFVILLAMNMGPKNKASGADGEGSKGGINDQGGTQFTESESNMIELEYGLRKGFNNPPRADSKNPADRKLLANYEKIQELKSKRKGVEGTSPTKQATPNGTKLTPNLTVEFDDGAVALSRSAKAMIAELAQKDLMGKDWVVEVRGHVSASEAKSAERAARNEADASTDEGALSMFGGSPDGGTGAGFQLSYQRAYAVASELSRYGIPWRRLRVVACSDMDRVNARVDGDPSKNRKNQRVEVIQSTDRVPPDPASLEPGRSQH